MAAGDVVGPLPSVGTERRTFFKSKLFRAATALDARADFSFERTPSRVQSL